MQEKDKKKHLRISQQINPFHLRELAWTLILKASTTYFPPQIPHLAEGEYLNTVGKCTIKFKNFHTSNYLKSKPPTKLQTT